MVQDVTALAVLALSSFVAPNPDRHSEATHAVWSARTVSHVGLK